MKILITGGAGYIGSHVVKLLGSLDHELFIVDNLSTGNKEQVLYGELIVADLSDRSMIDSILSSISPDIVMHFAGSTSVSESVQNPNKYFSNNTTNSKNLIDCCTKYKVKNFIFSSTAAVYGETENGLADESTQTNPTSPYGESKLMVEQYLKEVSLKNESFKYVILRYFNVAGADIEGIIGQKSKTASHLIKVNCQAAIGIRDFVNIYGNDYPTKDGTGVRDYIHVCDLADAHLETMKYLLKNRKSDIFNCGYSKGYSVLEVISSVKKISGQNYPVKICSKREGDLAKLIADNTKIKTTINWTAKYESLDTIVSSALKWEKKLLSLKKL